MTDFLWPVALVPSASESRLRDLSGRFTSVFSGTTRTVSRPGGDLLGLSLQFNGLTDQKRALLQSVLAALRGGVHRVWCRDHGYSRRRGSWLSPELLTNPTFDNGTAGWSAVNATLSAADRVMRVAGSAPGAIAEARQNSIAVTQYAPFACRSFITKGRGFAQAPIGITLQSGGITSTDYALSDGRYAQAALVMQSTTADARAFVANGTTSWISGDYIDGHWSSLARCALIDNGSNFLLQSDEFDATWTATRASVDDQFAASPDGNTTADHIVEDSTASATHEVSQTITVSSAAADYAFAVALKANARTWARLVLTENTGSTSIATYFNLATGAAGTTLEEANFTSIRPFVQFLGNDWYYCCIIGRKTNAATSLTAFIRLATGDNGQTYSGNGTSGLIAWRATVAQSSVPMRLAETTTTALPTGTAQTASGIYLKGLPVSGAGLLLRSDQVQIGKELFLVTETLDSDATGKGFLKLHRPPRAATTDSAAVIAEQPMGLFMLADSDNGWSNAPAKSGPVSGANVVLIEAPE